MEKVLLFLIVASALSAVSPVHQYHFVYERKNWAEARSYCREHYTDLATIDNKEDMNILKKMANASQMVYSQDSYVPIHQMWDKDCVSVGQQCMKRAWIGLTERVNSWRWLVSEGDTSRNHEIKFTNWNENEPDNYHGGESCGRIAESGEWGDISCGSLRKAVCSDVVGQNVKFVFVNIPMNWTEAQSYCRKHHSGLASVRNMSENERIRQLIPSGKQVWIGLFRDTWKWVDGSNSSFRFWGKAQPNSARENCGAVNFSWYGHWEDSDCDREIAFICYSVPVFRQVVKVKLMTSSSLDLNDAAVQENLLKQLKLKLKDRGVKGDVKLSWKTQPGGKIFHKVEDKEHEA
ncbi:C-type mannose receptor 2-like [Leuresthes tenuis]|uniref:C-type mannose receptor 2-like n=1 Tax=Leuresthes tenuis TaxID=355514 RepID=UPI003B51522E